VQSFDPRPLAQCLDLRGSFGTAVRDDLLDDSQARFNPFDVRCVLGGFFGSLAGEELTHLLLVLKPSLERAHANSAQDRNGDDDHKEYEK
jgi:hypothetical protein